MKGTSQSRILIAGTNSGCGKTTVTIALIAALKARGLATASFKCGPDYIDPMFHREALGVPAHNLDPYFSDREGLRSLFAANAGGDISVIEGVMGYYDGIGAEGRCSTYDVARAVEAPVVLIINARGMSTSAGALLRGFAQFRQDSNVKGVIFNNINAMTYPLLREVAEQAGVRAYGYLAKDDTCALESRNLGLVTAQEVEDILSRIERLGKAAQETVDIDGLLELAASAPEITGSKGMGCYPMPFEHAEREEDDGAESRHATKEKNALNVENADDADNADYKNNTYDVANMHGAETTYGNDGIHTSNICRKHMQRRPRIAVSRDKAFCFMYSENIELLEELGCEIAYFSPLADEKLPEGISGLYLCGGYPELYAKELSANASMLESVRTAIEAGLPTIAECGGFMYLHGSIDEIPMAGVIHGDSFRTHHLQRFGYTKITAAHDNLLCAAGESIRAHEFHYYDSEDNGEDYIAEKASNGKTYRCCHATDTMYAGYPHIYLPANRRFAEAFVRKAAEYGSGWE